LSWLWAASLSAQQLEPMLSSFAISANPYCDAPDPTAFTCAATGNQVTSFTLPDNVTTPTGCTLGTNGNCHFEYCVAAAPPAQLNSDGTVQSCGWANAPKPSTFQLQGSNGNVTYTVYGAYRLVYRVSDTQTNVYPSPAY
jgi:hypothetical protein